MNDRQGPSLLITEADMQALRALLFTKDGCENFAVLLCGHAKGPDFHRLLVREIVQTPPHAYHQRLDVHLEIAPSFLNTIITRSLSAKLTPVLVHSHPHSREARYSPSDDYGERRLLPILQQLLPHALPASLLLSDEQIRGRLLRDDRFVPLAGVEIKGPVCSFFLEHDTQSKADALDDRTIRAIGTDGLA